MLTAPPVAPAYRVKAGTYGRPYRATLRDALGNPLDLTGDRAWFVMRARAGGPPVINTEAFVLQQSSDEDDPNRGVVSYIWQEGDLDDVGVYYAEFKVLDSGGEFRTPNDTFNVIRVVANLDPPPG